MMNTGEASIAPVDLRNDEYLVSLAHGESRCCTGLRVRNRLSAGSAQISFSKCPQTYWRYSSLVRPSGLRSFKVGEGCQVAGSSKSQSERTSEQTNGRVSLSRYHVRLGNSTRALDCLAIVIIDNIMWCHHLTNIGIQTSQHNLHCDLESQSRPMEDNFSDWMDDLRRQQRRKIPNKEAQNKARRTKCDAHPIWPPIC